MSEPYQASPDLRNSSLQRQAARYAPSSAASSMRTSRPSQSYYEPSEPDHDSDPYAQDPMSYVPQANQSANPRPRHSYNPSSPRHSPPRHVAHYSNLRQQFNIDETESEEQHNRRPAYDGSSTERPVRSQRQSFSAASDPHPPIAYYRTSTYDPEQRYSQASTVQETSARAS
jgi:hypothetical protein